MCGRYGLPNPNLVALAGFGIDDLEAAPEILRRVTPRYNIAPTQDVPVVLKIVVEDEGRRVLTAARWGLVPPWAEDPGVGSRLINARAEAVAEKPAFRSAFRHRRCLIPADHFFESEQRGPRGAKQAYAIRRRDRQPFAFAGPWEEWHPKGEKAGGEEALRTCTIITTEANSVMAPVHHRMPVIVAPEEYDRWLDPETPLEELKALLRPAPDDWLEAYPVSRRVNDPRADDPLVLEPAGAPPA